MLNAIRVPHNDTTTVPSGEMTTISSRELISLMITGAVDAIFAPIETMEMEQGEVEGMSDLEAALALLKDVASFYTYAHEVEEDPPFPSLTQVFDATDSKATDYDPRLENQTCLDGTVDCPALGARLRIASLACESMTVPPDSFEGQPDQIEGLGFVFESINSYPRASDGLTTDVSCETLSNGSVVINTVTPPSCASNDA